MKKLQLLTQSMNGKIILLTSVFVIGFLVFGGLSMSTLNTAKVHGPHYNRVVQNKDLLADVLPPPNYIVETYLTAFLMAETDSTERLDQLVEHYGNLKKEYFERQNHWKENLADGPLKNEINETSRVPAVAFFDAMGADFIPALRAGDKELATKLLATELAPLYEAHRASVDVIVDTTIKNAEATEAEVAGLISGRQTVMLIVVVALMAGVMGLAWWLSKAVRRQEREMARISSMVEQAPLNSWFVDEKFTIQYMNPASTTNVERIESHLPVQGSELIGKSLQSVFRTEKGEPAIKPDAHQLPAEAQVTVGPDTIKVSANAINDEHGTFMGSLVTWEIITEQLELERQVAEQAEIDRQKAETQRREAEEVQKKVDVILGVMAKVAERNFDVEIPNLGDDAIGQVGNSLRTIVDSMQEALREVSEVSNNVATAATEMSSASAEISRGAQHQAARLEETAASLEEITSTVRQNSENAQEARALANGSRDIATEGGAVVGDAVKAMEEINESSNKISDIITTIDEIAFQTNLLALNAAVEAARAGEQGRGFAVVASEVRNLAQRSASSAKEIKTLIQDSAGKVVKGTELVNRSGETLGEIVDSVKRVTDIVAEIAAASQEQLGAIQQVTGAVTQMDKTTQESANQTEELAGTSSSVLDRARQLEEVVNQFDLGNGSSSSPGFRQSSSVAPIGAPIAAAAMDIPMGNEFMDF